MWPRSRGRQAHQGVSTRDGPGNGAERLWRMSGNTLNLLTEYCLTAILACGQS